MPSTAGSIQSTPTDLEVAPRALLAGVLLGGHTGTGIPANFCAWMGGSMRDRERDSDHEAQWARELDNPQSAALERQAVSAEERLRADGANLADLRSEWADFDRASPVDGDAVQRDFVRAQHLAYARVVDDLLRQEVGEGLRRQAPVDDDFAELLAGRPAPPPPPQDRGAERPTEHNTDARGLPPAPRISDAERKLVQAEAAERIARPIPSPGRPAEARPEDWYLGRSQQLDQRAHASVGREVDRLKGLPELATREAVAGAVVRTAADFETDRSNGIDNEKLRTRLYALAIVHDLRAREEVSARLRAVPVAPPPDRPSPMEQARSRPVPPPSPGREVTPGSAPRVQRFAIVDDIDPRERDDAPTIPDEGIRTDDEVFANRVPPQVEGERAREQPQDSTNPGRRNLRAPGPRREDELVELSTRDIMVEQDEAREPRGVADATLNTRLSERYRERAAGVAREMASVAADADREYFALTRDAEGDPDVAREVQEVDAVVARIKATPQSHDPIELSAKVNELRTREREEPDITEGRLRVERLAFGVLAREAFVRQNALLGRATRDHMEEIGQLPTADRLAFVAEAAILLREPAYNDRHAMNREVLRGEDDRVGRFAAVARTAPSVAELERQAKWREVAFHDRVERRVKALLFSPERDDALRRGLAEARVRVAMPDDVVEKRLAHEEAVELAEVIRRLPIARSLDIETPASPFRAMHT